MLEFVELSVSSASETAAWRASTSTDFSWGFSCMQSCRIEGLNFSVVPNSAVVFVHVSKAFRASDQVAQPAPTSLGQR